MAMMHLYDKKRKRYFKTEELVQLNSLMMTELETKHKEDLEKGYGYIHVDETYYTAEYIPYELVVSIDHNNDIISEGTIDGMNHVSIDKKEYYKALYEKNRGMIVKVFDNNIHIFEPSENLTKVYDPELNIFELDLNKYRDYVVKKIRGCEQEVRNHGFYYTFWDGMTFVQPFRWLPDNDLQALSSMLAEKFPKDQRAVKLFVVKDGVRQTDVGTYKWLAGPQVLDQFLELQTNLIVAYSGLIKECITKFADTAASTNSLDYLRMYESDYINIILNKMAEVVNNMQQVGVARELITKAFKEYGIKPLDKLNI